MRIKLKIKNDFLRLVGFVFLITISSLLFSGCLKEMKEKEITVSVKEEDPIKILQSLTVDARKTDVLILGTPHLKSFQKNIDKEVFDSLLSVINKFSPDQIGIQALPPNYFLMLSEYKEDLNVTNPEIKKILDLGMLSQKVFKISFKKASDTSDSLLNQISFVKQDQINKFRKDLVKMLVASYNIYTAALQWSYIPFDIRSKFTEIPKPIKEELESILSSYDEINLIAISLAKNLNLQRLIPVDDQQDKDIYNKIIPELNAQISNDSLYDRAINSDIYKTTDTVFKESYNKKNLLPYFLFINSQEYAIKDAEAQWGIFYKLNLKSGLDRTRAALWEVRNLNITSNIRRATSLKPGSKMLVIVNPSHKPFLEAYLSSLGDIKILQLNSLIKK